MAILLMEGFDWIDNGLSAAQLATIADRKWGPRDFTFGEDATTEAGIGGNGRCLTLQERFHDLRIPFVGATPAASAEIGFAFWFNRKDQGASSTFGSAFFGLFDTNGSTYQLNLRISNSGFLGIYKNTTLIEQTDFNIYGFHNEWHYYEMKGVIDDVNGSYEVRIDGVTVAVDTGPVDTRQTGNGLIDAIQFEGMSDFQSASDPRRSLFDNIIVWDDSGSDLTDFPSAPTLIRSIFPDADGDDEQWTTSSGTDSFALVNETAPHDDDTDYIQDTVSANRSLFTYDNVDTHTTYLGIQINSVVRETDGSDFSLINTFKQGGTLYPESSQAIAGQTFENLADIRETDPDTSSAWTESGLNSLQAGVEVA